MKKLVLLLVGALCMMSAASCSNDEDNEVLINDPLVGVWKPICSIVDGDTVSVEEVNTIEFSADGSFYSASFSAGDYLTYTLGNSQITWYGDEKVLFWAEYKLSADKTTLEISHFDNNNIYILPPPDIASSYIYRRVQ